MENKEEKGGRTWLNEGSWAGAESALLISLGVSLS